MRFQILAGRRMRVAAWLGLAGIGWGYVVVVGCGECQYDAYFPFFLLSFEKLEDEEISLDFPGCKEWVSCRQKKKKT